LTTFAWFREKPLLVQNVMKSKTKLLFVAAAVLGVIAIAAVVSFLTVDHIASATQSRTLRINCEFDKFRQIMVRKNATAAIIGQSGMTLVDERIDHVKLDTTKDDRPLLNAILGHSKTELDAVKEITVHLDDPSLNADRLVLRQIAEVGPEAMNVQTRSKEAAGNLEEYQTTLQARPKDGATELTLRVSMRVRVQVPKIFIGRADAKVQEAADNAVNTQANAIQAFINEHADERLILPKLSRN